MAQKPLYIVVAVVGIAAASGGAWWYQNRPVDASAGTPAALGQAGSQTAGSAGGASGAVSLGGAGPAAAPASGAASGPRVAGVEVAKVETMRLVDDTQAVGALRSRQSVMVRPEVSGRVARINFRDGERVQKGQLMVQFDDQLPRAQVAQAEAELSIARANHKRNQELVAQNFISQRSVDESSAAMQVGEAKLALARATADRLRILAPFDGTVGLRGVNVGDYLKDGADIVNIEDLDAILVDFRLPERFQAKVRRGQTAMVAIDALPGRKFPALLQAVDPLVDANGRSVGVRGCIDNRSMQLRPGMFARVTAVFGENANAMVLPEEALVPQGGRQVVYKVVAGEGDTKVSQRTEVKLGLRVPGKVEILEGLAVGDVVVIAGQQRLQRDGTPVRVIETPARGGPGGSGGPGGAGGAGGPAAAASGAASAASAATAGPRGGPGARMAGGPGGRAGAAARPEGPNPCLQAMGDAAGDGGAAPSGPRGPRGPQGAPAAPTAPRAPGPQRNSAAG
jgi:membrane fusion protein (multidrug efflux system)